MYSFCHNRGVYGDSLVNFPHCERLPKYPPPDKFSIRLVFVGFERRQRHH